MVVVADGFLASPPSQTRPRVLKTTTTILQAGPSLSLQPWRVSLSFTLPSSTGRIVTRRLEFEANFEVDEGYEPPQGRLTPSRKPAVVGEEGGTGDDAWQYVDTGGRNRWLLSEDPDDRKDGLWIWGLFEEPLYPFCLLQLTLKDIPLMAAGVADGAVAEVVPSFTAFAQIDHIIDRKTNQVELRPAEVTLRIVETVKADLAGLATADISTDEVIGSIRFSPVLR